MQDTAWIAARLAIVLAFLLGMPLLALPGVQQALGDMFNPDEEAASDQPETSSQVDLRRRDELDRVVKREPIDSLSELEVLGGELPEDAARPSALERLKQRLIHLGATYMVLERVGVDGTRYRFTCQLPVADGSPYRRKLRAVAADPVEAMAQVQHEIETERQAASSNLPRPTVKLR